MHVSVEQMFTCMFKDEKLDIIYTNAEIDRKEWHTYEVGKSRFNDEALKQAGKKKQLEPAIPKDCRLIVH